jgi:hypothetical protein
MSINKFIRSLLPGHASRHAPVAQDCKTPRHHWVSNPWHAVSIVSSTPACHKARSLARLRFLSSQAPSLPLEGCEMRKCSCHYRHHEDRRRRLRRAADVAASGAYWRGPERRQSGGRRATDAT